MPPFTDVETETQKNLSNLPKVTQLVSGSAGLKPKYPTPKTQV